ncbi:MAG: hypothetical protein GQ574_23270 [Crocinitomix sp.]|nr:hypothetical protein [Crocinitomix sp.]
MNKYLIEILKIQNSVILPGLGALMVPSQKTGKIVFNPHLKFNDGSLARFIAEKEGIDEQESQNKVAKFVREIEAEIGKGNSYDMFEFGKFFKNKAGEIDFKMYKADDQSAAAVPTSDPKPEKTVTPPVKEKAEAPAEKTEAPKKATKKPAAKKTTTKKTKEVKEVKEKTTKAEEDTKQSKNKFIPPVVEEAKEDLTAKAKIAEEKVAKKVESIEEKVTDKVEKVEEKIEKKVESIEKGVTGIVSEVKEKIEEKAEAVKEKVEEKVEAIKEKVTGKEDKKAVITPVDSSQSKTDDKQSKNTFVPPAEKDSKATDSSKDKGVGPATVAAGAAVVTGAVAAASSGSKTVIEKTKETTIIKETAVKEEKKKRRIWPWIIILLLLIGIAVAGYFFKDKIMAYFNDGDAVVADSTAVGDSTSNGSTIIPLEIEDTLSNDINAWVDSSGTDLDSMGNPIEDPMDETDPVDDPIEDPVDEIVPVVSGTNTGSFHLIGNSFGEEANAERYAQKMQDKGYPAKVLGRFDGLYMVSLKSYDSRDAANDGRSSVSADAGSAWVFKYAK